MTPTYESAFTPEKHPGYGDDCMSQFEELVKEVRNEFPGFRVVAKYDSPLMRVLNVLLKVVTLGFMSTFMTDFTTTIGATMYTPTSWARHSDLDKCIVLKHERVHLRQQRKYGVWLFALLYLFVFLPVGLAYFRARFEMEAYAVTIRETYKACGLEFVTSERFKRSIIEVFTGPSYAWMWPFRKRVERWYDSVIASLE